MNQTELGNLAKKYANETITKDEYRQSRSNVLSGFLSGETPLPVIDYPDLIRPDENEALDITEQRQERGESEGVTADAAESQKKTPPSPHHPKKDQTWKLYAGGAIAVLVVVSLLLIFLPGEPAKQAIVQDAKPTPSPTRDIVAKTTITPAISTLIEEFISSNSWSNESLQSFLRSWEQLPDEDKRSSGNSAEIGQLANVLYRQLQEERAIFNLNSDDTQALDNQRLLVSFAESIGIEDPRITMPELASVPEPVIEATEETAEVAIPQEPEEIISTNTDDVPAMVVNETTASASEDIEQDIPPALPEPAEVATTEVTPAEPAKTEVSLSSIIAEVVETVEGSNKKSGNCNVSLVNSRRPYCRDDIPGIGKGPTMVVIPGGKFVMGGEEASENPKREVSIANPLAVSVHEITFAEFQQYCQDNNNPCPKQPWADKDYPVVNVSWDDATAYVRWLGDKTGQRYRLPSEAEWEYAARAGTTTTYPFGNEIDISYAVFSERKALSAPLPKTDRSINRNKFRLYHIVGNVREWIADTWSNNYENAPLDGSANLQGDPNTRIVRGGAYNDTAKELRSGARTKLSSNSADKYTGFRVIQDL